MKIKPQAADQAAHLRRRAEDRLHKRPGNQRSTAVAADTQRLLHELQVHQIELEMQNAELRQARDELEVALENYTDLYDFAPGGYFTLTTAGIIRQVNLTGARLVSIERSRLVGQSFGQMVAAAHRPVFNSFLKEVFAGENSQFIDIELLSKAQTRQVIRVRAKRSPAGLDCRAVVLDITELKREEEKVRTSEIRYRRLFEAAQDGVLLLDPDTRKITGANPFMTKLLGYRQDQFIGKELFEIGLLKDKSASQEMFQKLKQKHQVRYENLPLETEDGRQQQVEVVANLYQENGHAVIQCNIRDITERKRAEQTVRRLEVMTASNRKLEQEIIRRKTLEQALKTSERQLRHLSRGILLAQEDERKRISRELHDTVLQTLVGISVHLSSLTPKPADNPTNLRRKIAQTQLLVEKSLAMVHRFAMELRPTVLDDLGLISALHTFMKDFMKRTGVRARLTAYAAVNQLPIGQSAVLYRVALEALNNVGIHAQASAVEVEIEKLPDWICLTITDDGKSFDVKRVFRTKGNGRLGLLGMRERLENRSFDHYFGTLAGVRGFDDPNAMTLPNGKSVFYQPDPKNPNGYLLPFHLDTRNTSAQKIPSTSHSWHAQHHSWNKGKMDNWVPAHRQVNDESAPYVMGYHTRADIPFQFALAEAFTICDAYHCSVLGPTWPNRMYWMTGTIDPDGKYGGPIIQNVTPDEGYGWKTYPERLEEAGISWKVYQQDDNFDCDVLEQFKAFRESGEKSPLRLKGMVREPEGKFEYDVMNDQLPTISWIIPTSFQSEHPDYMPAAGAAFIASKIDAIAANPEVWAKTVFILNYDENDGLFDHVAPPVPPAGTPHEFIKGEPVGAGFRVPCIIISPWTAGGWVCSQLFDHTSVLQFVEKITGVKEKNISDWRRSTFGDLTSAFRFDDAKAGPPELPDAASPYARAKFEAGNLPEPTLPGAEQQPPTQEKGDRKRVA